jgi:dihydroorotase
VAGDKWRVALQLFAEMRAAGVQPNGYTFNALIGACRVNLPAALAVFEAMRKAQVALLCHTCVTLPHLCDTCVNVVLPCVNLPAALAVFEAMRKAQVALLCHTSTACLALCVTLVYT